MFGPEIGPAFSTTRDGPLRPLWTDFNYAHRGLLRLGFEHTPISFDGDINSLGFKYVGGFYSNFFGSTSAPIVSTDAFIKLDYKNDLSVETAKFITTEPLQKAVAIRELNSTTSITDIGTVGDFNNANFSLAFHGYSYCLPSGLTGSFGQIPDYANPNFSGRHRFALDSFEFNMNVSATVESKFWCCKAKTGENMDLWTGLNQLSTRYEQPLISKGDTLRDSWEIAGAHVGKPIYYRDLLAKIADEFKVFINDENGICEFVSKGGVTQDWEFNESNTFSPWNDNITLSETDSGEIYNKLVVKFAKNHMTGNYGKQVKFENGGVEYSNALLATKGEALTVSYASATLNKASSTLSKIGITEKTLNIELDFIRDNATIVPLLLWLANNHYRTRAKATVEVSKRYFLNGKIGDGVKLNFPKLPSFYKNTMQVTKIVNKSNKFYSVELEEFL
jgi:hypothetical protein